MGKYFSKNISNYMKISYFIIVILVFWGCKSISIKEKVYNTERLYNIIAQSSDKSTIDLKNEIYKFDKPLILKNRKKLVIKNLKIVGNLEEGFLLLFNDCYNITLNNVSIDGQFAGSHGIKLEKCNNITIINSTLKNIGNERNENTFGLFYRSTNHVHIVNNIFQDMRSSKVTRAIKQTDHEGMPSQYGEIIGNDISNIFPAIDGDGIYIEAIGTDTKSVFLEISKNRFLNNAKRFIKLHASDVVINDNTGVNNLSTDMYAFISAYGDNIIMKRNRFLNNAQPSFQIGIELGASNIGTIKNITIKKNSLMTNFKEGVEGTKGISFEKNATNIVVSDNIIDGFANPITTSYSKKSSISSLLVEKNEIKNNSGHVITFFGDIDNIEIKKNVALSNIENRYFIVVYKETKKYKTIKVSENEINPSVKLISNKLY